MLRWLTNLLPGKRVDAAAGVSRRPAGRLLRAKYDAAQTTAENRRHWAMADALSADGAMSPQVRRVLRSRSRYEVANNGFARGIVNTLANHVIGTGPRLQMLTDDADANRLIEREFARWAKATQLALKLWTMRVSQCESGEVFAVLSTNPQIDSAVKLDLRLVEADRVSTPWQLQSDRRVVDGIRFDEFGNAVSYAVLRSHPGELAGWSRDMAYDVLPAEAVLHLYRPERPGQSRGVPEITSSLSLFAMLRRYSLAVLSSAEQAALLGGVIYTDAPADVEAANVEAMDQIELDRGTWMTLPYGWKVSQVRAEQPTTMYGDYTSKVLNEIARPLNMPFNIAMGNSAGYNYASGRLDHQSFFKAIRIDQCHVAATVLDRVLTTWLNEAVLVEGLLPQWLRERGAIEEVRYRTQWFWDGLEHVDPLKEANAQATRLGNNTTTLAAEYARQGLDWENELRQRAKERALMDELGLAPAAVAAPGDEEDTVDESESDHADAP